MLIFKNKIECYVKFVIKCILIFMIVYKNSPIIHYTFITSERVAVLIIIAISLLKNRGKLVIKLDTKSTKNWLKYMEFQGVLFFYSGLLILLWGIGEGNTLIEEIINFIIVAVPILILLPEIIDNTEELMKILQIISLLQCALIIMGIINGTVAQIIDNSVFNQSVTHMGGYAAMRELGYPGGIACITAKGALQLSLGSLACAFFILRDKKVFLNWIYFAIISVTMIVVARTGIVISLVLFYLIIVNTIFFNRKNQILMSVLGVLFCFGIIIIQMFDVSQIIEKISNIFSRVTDLLNRGLYNSFFRWYFFSKSTEIPELSWITLIGIGITSGISGNGIAINVDGGFFRMYAAIGLPAAILYYVVNYKLFKNNIKIIEDRKEKVVAVGFLLILLLGELKEFYFYSRYMIILFFLYTILSERDRNLKRLR